MTYIADSFHYQGKNEYISTKFSDLFKPKDNRSADEITIDIINRLELNL